MLTKATQKLITNYNKTGTLPQTQTIFPNQYKKNINYRQKTIHRQKMEEILLKEYGEISHGNMTELLHQAILNLIQQYEETGTIL